MDKHLSAAQAQIAAQLAESQHSNLFSAGALKRLVTGGVAAATLAFGLAAPETVHAADNQVYGKIIGGSIGAFAGAKLSRNMTGAERAALIAGTTAAGTMAGDMLTRENRMQQEQERMRQQQERMRMSQSRSYQQYDDGWRNQRQMVDAPRPYESRTAQPQARSGPTVLDATAFNMPEVVVSALRSSGNMGLVPDGPSSLQSFPEGEHRLREVADALVKAGRMYGAASKAWEDAQLYTGAEGTNKRTKAAETVKESQKLLQTRTQDWANVRNTLAVRGFDVQESDNLVRANMRELTVPKTYDFRVGSNYSPR